MRRLIIALALASMTAACADGSSYDGYDVQVMDGTGREMESFHAYTVRPDGGGMWVRTSPRFDTRERFIQAPIILLTPRKRATPQ